MLSDSDRNHEMLTGETLVESQKGISNGAASAKQTLDEANVIRDERGAGEQSSHSSADSSK